MISAATAMPMPETGPSVTRNWMKANVIAGAIYAVVGTLTLVTGKLLAIDDPATAMPFRGIAAAIALAGTMVPIVIYAMLTGAVLGEKLPAFSQRAWIAMHGSIGVFMGIGLAALTLFGPVSNDAPMPTPPVPALLAGLAIAGVFAAILGAVAGGLQALVLRKAATGAGKWVVLSAIAACIMLIVMVAVAYALGQKSSGFAGGLAMQVTVFATMIGAAVIMLPALNRLTPRG